MSQQSAEIKDLAAALAKTQAEIKGAVKDSANPFFKASYADLQSVWDACRLPLTKNGLSVTQTTDILTDGKIILYTTLMHSSGQWVRGAYPINPIKSDPQGMGSATTYARRYALAALVGVYQTDDDGESAMGRKDNLPRVAPNEIGDGMNRNAEEEYFIPQHIGGALAGKHPSDCNSVILRQKMDEVEAKYHGKVMPVGAIRFLKESRPYAAEPGASG